MQLFESCCFEHLWVSRKRATINRSCCSARRIIVAVAGKEQIVAQQVGCCELNYCVAQQRQLTMPCIHVSAQAPYRPLHALALVKAWCVLLNGHIREVYVRVADVLLLHAESCVGETGKTTPAVIQRNAHAQCPSAMWSQQWQAGEKQWSMLLRYDFLCGLTPNAAYQITVLIRGMQLTDSAHRTAAHCLSTCMKGSQFGTVLAA